MCLLILGVCYAFLTSVSKCELASNYFKNLAALRLSLWPYRLANHKLQATALSRVFKELSPSKSVFPVLFCAYSLVLIAQTTRELFSVSFLKLTVFP